ncbi:MAG: hypothetical protein IPJ38_23050 [Dechloromonas sp.]|uniref:Uncharacterized protein n=1 Tax=Candidatus Dechloromonas phosphorivorans TaxID=2899244 RepID=A0A935MXS0_9RHOO|nr:hypothetical protein [Candidatus Dechloromonas phosphorivorans]
MHATKLLEKLSIRTFDTQQDEKMFNRSQKLAALICHGDAVLNPKRWLAEEASDLAIKIADLDKISSRAILPLAKLVALGETDAKKLSLSMDIDESKVDEYLEALCEFKFAEKTWNGYKTTQTGEQVFEAIAKRMVERELFEVKSRLQQLEYLIKAVR